MVRRAKMKKRGPKEPRQLYRRRPRRPVARSATGCLLLIPDP